MGKFWRDFMKWVAYWLMKIKFFDDDNWFCDMEMAGISAIGWLMCI
jgi:hypothetical protein